jgi:hypothetical protein
MISNVTKAVKLHYLKYTDGGMKWSDVTRTAGKQY